MLLVGGLERSQSIMYDHNLVKLRITIKKIRLRK